MSKSAFSGKIIEIPGLYVDNFEQAAITYGKAYFLSHCHSDHIQGLMSLSFLQHLEKKKAYIYMSLPSATIVKSWKEAVGLEKYIKVLDLGSSLVTLPYDSENEEILIDVTLIPAGHCLGSVMFLFRTNKHTILYTGDFRINPNDIPKYKQLHDKDGNVLEIDVLYVDSTFMDNDHEYFPKRTTCIEETVEEIRSWLNKNENNKVALHTSATYGYEYVYNEIYKRLGEKVFVNDIVWKVYSLLLDYVYGVTNCSDGIKVHVCRNRSEKHSHKDCHYKLAGDYNFLYMHFSALKWCNYEMDDSTLYKVSNKRIDVCFPTHCSKSELMYFINYMTPKRVIGFCDGNSTNINVLSASLIDEVPCKTMERKRKSLIEREDIPKKSTKKIELDVLKDIFDL